MIPDPEAAALDAEILALVARGEEGPRDDARFDALARRVYVHQYARNMAYRPLARVRGGRPETVRTWRDLPACPTDAFKEADLATFPPAEAAAVFESSGTSRGRPGRHFLPRLDLYEAALLESFRHYVLPDRPAIRLAILAPPPEEAPRSSLGHMLATVRSRLGTPASAWFVRGGVLLAREAEEALRVAAGAGEPVAVLATAFALVQFLDDLAARGVRVALPAASRLMETGGYKGRSREVPRDELYNRAGERLGIPEAFCVNEYGMTEMGSQFYDGGLRAALGLPGPEFPGEGGRVKRPPPWVRTMVADTESALDEVADGGVGLLRHVDLVNRGSVAALLTGDLGRRRGDGFEVLGRASGAEARGCSLAMEDLLGRRHV
ncbi:MAG: hypothetical protein L0216_01415 [Planctomycetales bacterium]|nr:hypothetical protein [Planctomycetales bacterium]